MAADMTRGVPSAVARRDVLRLGAGVSLLAMLPASVRAATGAAAALYKDPRAPVDLRVRDLLSRMTLEEKVAQLITLSRTKRDVMDDALRFDPAKATAGYPHGIGQVARPSDRGGAATANNTVTAASIAATGSRRAPADTIAFVNAAQKWARESTRLGIPILFHEETLHGFMAPEATSFPQAIVMDEPLDAGLA